MKMTNNLLTMLLLALLYIAGTQGAYAQSVTPWTGVDKKVTLKAGESKTFSYKATENGSLYIMAPTASTGLGLTISGGWYHDEALDPDFQFDIAEPYDNGAGVFATIRVFEGNEIRFTIEAATSQGADAIKQTSFTLTSKFFADDFGGNTKDNAIEMPFDTPIELPIYTNSYPEYHMGFSHTTFIRFVAPIDGLASVFTGEYLIYYINEDEYGFSNMKFAVQAQMTDDHEFPIERGQTYIVMLPITRPTSVTLKLTADRPGQLATYPIELESIPATLSLENDNNWYRMDVSSLDENYMLEITPQGTWKGSVEYWNNPNNANTWLATDTIRGTGEIFVKNLHPTRLESTKYLYLNVATTSSTDESKTFNIRLRKPTTGEDFTTAKTVQSGETTFVGTNYENWFTFTATRDMQLEITADTLLSYICYNGNDANIMNEFNLYRAYEGEQFYICVKTPDKANHTLSIVEHDLVIGDYCDLPIDFVLGTDIVIEDRGEQIMNYRRFQAQESGTAIFQTTCPNWVENGWSVVFRTDCEGKSLDFKRSEYEDENTGDLGLAYEISVTKGETYIIEITSFTNEGNEAILHTRFQEATDGSNYETALPITTLNEQVDIPNQPELTRWYTYEAGQTGFYTIKSKLGLGSTMRTMVGENPDNMVNSTTDNTYEEAYMAGYKVSKIYVEQGTRFYVCITIGSNPGTTAGTDRYLTVSFAEARPGEYFGQPIEAKTDETYHLPNTDDAYDTWYTVTIPAGVVCTFRVGSDITPAYGSLHFYADEQTQLNATNANFVMESQFDASGKLCGKSYTFAPADTVRVIYIKAEYQQNLHWWNITFDGDTAIEPHFADAPQATVSAQGTILLTIPQEKASQGCKVTLTNLGGQTVYEAFTTNVHTTLPATQGIHLITIHYANGQSQTIKVAL